MYEHISLGRWTDKSLPLAHNCIWLLSLTSVIGSSTLF